LQFLPIATGFKVILEEHNIDQIAWPEIEPQLFVFNCYSVFVIVCVGVVVVAEAELNPERKRIQNEIILDANF